MSKSDSEFDHRDALSIFCQTMLDELRIDIERLMLDYGVDVFQYYLYDVDRKKLTEVTEGEFLLFRKLRRTFSNNCTCAQFEGITERFDSDIGALRLVSEDGEWLQTNEGEELELISFEAEMERAEQAAKLFKRILAAHGLAHITNTPRLGAHFIKGWAHPFSNDWYDAECLNLLGSYSFEEAEPCLSLVDQLSNAYRIGRARSDQIWRQRHFVTSHSGARQADNLKVATRRMADSASKRTKEKLSALQGLWKQLCECDSLLSRNDSKAADAIFEHLRKNLDKYELRSLRIKKTGSPIGQDAIRRYLKELRNIGRI